MIEEPLQRLNYYNGQRLEAGDFRLEQDYHMRIQRWLTRALFSPGVADGLEITLLENRSKVVVGPGLALDDLGRPIILTSAQELCVGGPYLTVRYAEEKVAPLRDGCTVHHDGNGHGASWGGPSRIQAEPVFAWRNGIPWQDARELVLAHFELDDQCHVKRVISGPARYAVATQVSKVHTFALEGEKDIDADNPKRIYFHVRGRRPESIVLYLRAERFSTLYYTELGQHTHPLDVQLAGGDGEHNHRIESQTTGPHGGHNHVIANEFISVEDVGLDFWDLLMASPGRIFTSKTRNFWRLTITPQYRWKFGIGDLSYQEDKPVVTQLQLSTQNSGSHSHSYGNINTAANDALSRHSHKFSASSASVAGVANGNPPYAVREDEPPLTHIDRLQLSIDGVQVTPQVLEQIQEQKPDETWATLGNGFGGHPLVVSGTGAIQLHLLGVEFNEGEHWIELSVPEADAEGNRIGGRIHYNLYVE